MNQKWQNLFNQTKNYNLKMLRKILQQFSFVKNCPIIHIVGTNGKGSVAHLLHHNLQQKYKRVGLFTSPHLINPLERIRVNGQTIPEFIFWKICTQLPPVNNFFALFYLVAMIYFMQQKCDMIILEAGIGGRLDATNTVRGEYGILTNLDYDHTELLGNSLAEIGAEKYAIKNDSMQFYLPDFYQKFAAIFNQPQTFYLTLQGHHYQQQNFSLVQQFLSQVFGFRTVTNKVIKGRTEIFWWKNYWTIFDVAHNLSGIRATLKYLQTQQILIDNVVIMMKKTKQIPNIRQIFPHYKVFYYVKDTRFHDFKSLDWKLIDNLKHFYQNQQGHTLYIGSFELIGDLYVLKNNLR